ncbi:MULTISPECIES: Rpn family recombination-promoting nuclease/putative transposase [Kamptonema]|uniref:Rpn family recombination-promoting nuclease/putative transposase n=1 Tax=Kamptonema TaxID=1501433 RepID=UPI0001DAC226|nr:MULTISPECIES: Rpn family recombination-promoting nuclease/putative transposase [Kamptonema]CBN54244.1 conserved hypothetical protein [Kamptonema sp. PCC 6506]
MSELQADFDGAWKQALDIYFEAFLAFFFAEVHGLIDWSIPPQSLEQELQQIVGEGDSGKRFADKLFQVWLRDGEEAWVLIHVEVQSQVKSDFAKRMYQYNYRTFDRYERSAISLAVLGDEQASWRPSSYGYALGGCRVSLEFPIAKLLDYESQWQSLESSRNPFAVMVMAHLKTQVTRGLPQERKLWKWSLVRSLFDRGYSRDEVVDLFRFIDRMMRLPVELEQQFKNDLRRYQEDRSMRFLSQIEEMAMEEGAERGALQNARESVLEILEARFEIVPLEVRQAVNMIADMSVLRRLLREAIAIPSILDFQELLAVGEGES